MDYKVQVYVLLPILLPWPGEGASKEQSTGQELGVPACFISFPDCLLPLLRGQGGAISHSLC